MYDTVSLETVSYIRQILSFQKKQVPMQEQLAYLPPFRLSCNAVSSSHFPAAASLACFGHEAGS